MNNSLKMLPPKVELETKNVLKQLARSHRYLKWAQSQAPLLGYILGYQVPSQTKA